MPAYPAALDALANPGGTTKRNDPGYELHTVISTLNDIAEALEAKLGTGADVAAINELLVGTGAGATAFRKLLNADVDAAAAIAYSKLALTGAIVAGDMVDGAHYKKIGEATGSGASAALVVGSIPTTYRALYFEATLRSTVAAINTTVSMYLNNDGAANYDYERNDSQAAGNTASEGIAATTALLGYVPGATAGASIFGSVCGRLPDYAASGVKKTFHWSALGKYQEASSGLISTLGTGSYRSTSAITQIDIRATAGNWENGSRLTVWGLPA